MAINTRAYDWSTNNFGLAEWDDIGWSFDDLGSGQFFDSYSVDNFTPKDSPDDFAYTPVSAASSPGLSGVSAATSPTYTSLSVGSASYTSAGVSSAVFTDVVIIGES